MGEHEVKRRAVFLDRDGVLNRPVIRKQRPYPPSSLEEFELYPDVRVGCTRLKQENFLLIVITNQPDVGRGTQSRATVEALHQKLRSAISEIDDIQTCYHAGERYQQSCDCRKPKPGLLRRAVAERDIDLTRSYFIGDRWRDVECAHAVGCRSIFIDRGYDERLRTAPDFRVRTFGEAVEVVLCDAQAALNSSDR